MAYPTYHIFIFIKCVTKTYNVAKHALMLRAICVKKIIKIYYRNLSDPQCKAKIVYIFLFKFT